jgi:thiamine-phosphate pyrophosphorylase
MIMCMLGKNDIIAVSNRHLCTRPFLEQIERVCACRPKALILREKDLVEADYGMLAVQVLDICYHYEVPCLLHTYVEVARQLNHPYIHLPLHVLAQYAGKLKDFKQVGCSVHSVDEACLAVSYGATYLTAGHIYATACKPDVSPRGIEFLKEVCVSVKVPVYAIGGLHPGSARIDEVILAGAAGACVMSDMMRV